MKKSLLVAIFLLAAFIAPLPLLGEGLPKEEGMTGYLVSLRIHPPSIKIWTGGGDKAYGWFPEETVFTDLEGREVKPGAFIKEYRNKGVSLSFVDKKLVNVSAVVF